MGERFGEFRVPASESEEEGDGADGGRGGGEAGGGAGLGFGLGGGNETGFGDVTAGGDDTEESLAVDEDCLGGNCICAANLIEKNRKKYVKTNLRRIFTSASNCCTDLPWKG